ncbi:unnamed protein product [Lepeophtheirus salmonis]|uniref:(salmon louse) hypothetical protein n=1 Tax=Lepeophtheirus salmonis TaxID=72036 RepID=A0A7R8D270_LEPSM|nr:unnamed protein product [Lepeophtheirus salmonis]CAF3001888.1 unnamed protein product [Lepeophtheirus salmonis]
MTGAPRLFRTCPSRGRTLGSISAIDNTSCTTPFTSEYKDEDNLLLFHNDQLQFNKLGGLMAKNVMHHWTLQIVGHPDDYSMLVMHEKGPLGLFIAAHKDEKLIGI